MRRSFVAQSVRTFHIQKRRCLAGSERGIAYLFVQSRARDAALIFAIFHRHDSECVLNTCANEANQD